MGAGSGVHRAAVKGTYLLILHLERELADWQVGRLGRFTFAPGYYLYVGSAFGSGGLAARLAHHERRHKPRPHWHIDYLRAQAALVEAWAVASLAPLERCWAGALATAPGLAMPARGFGASDSQLASHLLYSRRMPARQPLIEALLGCAELAGAPRLTIDIRTYS